MVSVEGRARRNAFQKALDSISDLADSQQVCLERAALALLIANTELDISQELGMQLHHFPWRLRISDGISRL